jgi:Domain of unknown function (DUF4382)
MHTSTFCRHAAFVIAVAALAGCDGQSPGGTTSFSVMLKDAPGDVQHAVVTITEVDLVGTGGVHVLSQTPATVDLLTLAASATTLVQGVEVPSGHYNALRFKITGACLAVDDGSGGSSVYATAGYDGTLCGGATPGTLQAPSYAESGLKVTMASNSLVLTGAEKIVLVDFDVSQSFGHEASGWVMHPVVTGGDIEVTGSLHTTVQLGDGVTGLDLAQVSAALVQGVSDTVAKVALTDTDADGVFTADLLYMNPGSYTLGLVPPSGINGIITTPATPLAVDLASGQEVTEAFTVTGTN